MRILKRYAELIRNYKSNRIKSLLDNKGGMMLLDVCRGHIAKVNGADLLPCLTLIQTQEKATSNLT